MRIDVSNLLDLFFPPLCRNCGSLLADNEHELCSTCLTTLPRTNMDQHFQNQAESRLEGQATFMRAAAYCWYNKETTLRTMIHKAKYFNHPEILYRLTQQAITEWSGNGFFNGIDAVVPVPMHKQKMRERGYNQTDYIAQAFADTLHISMYEDALIRSRNDKAQAMQIDNALRISNVRGAFEPNKNVELKGKTILLVDDVLTTGATIAECAKQLHKHKNVKIVVFTLGISVK